MRLPALLLVAAVATVAAPPAAGAGALRAVGALTAPGPATGEGRKIAARLRALQAQIRADGPPGRAAAARFSSTTLRVDPAGRVQVYVEVLDAGPAVRARLHGLGLEVELVNADFRLLQGWIAVDALDRLAADPAVVRITTPGYGRPRRGAVATEGEAVHRCDLAGAAGLTGAGVTVGVVSDGVAGLATSQAAGDLPAVEVLVPGPGDEGTAMLEIVHDCAPGARLLFASGLPTSLAFIDAVNRLDAAGADIIVDDLGFTDQRFFEDDLIALNDRRVGQRRLRVSAAGNDGLSHYQGHFSPGPLLEGTPCEGRAHDFGGGNPLLRILVPAGGTATVILQWGNLFGRAADDYDLCVFDPDGNLIAQSTLSQAGFDDPLETVDVACFGPDDCVATILVTLFAGAPQLLELFCFNGSCDFLDFNTPFDAIFGHPAAPEVLAVAATPASDPTRIEAFSSGGPVTILFPVPEVRSKPDLTGVDRVSTSRPGFDLFPGTSAAAPHVAAVAALVLQSDPTLDPAGLRARLTGTAIDLGPPGPDPDFGTGRADALLATRQPPPPQATLGLHVNRRAFGPGQTLRLTGVLSPGATAEPVDAYVVVRLPDGAFLSLRLDGVLFPGIAPIATGFTPFLFAGELVRYTLTGAEPEGGYAWLGALARARTGTILGAIEETPFAVTR
ncbi:MAG: S8 family serine peptidase [Armatimonadota bacterium]|nr:S8 family serine peptidase [Armatimonadota bacterium]MDR7528908.1 S8 family serine peptidase [Armatimonadota bacterium]